MAELKAQLYEANNMIEAIKDGSVDALVLNKDGKSSVYSIESADYTYRILIEKFGEGALSISEEGLILYCNDYFSKLISIPANKIIGTYFDSYVDSISEFQKLKSALSNGPSKGEIVLNIEGRKLHVYASLTDLNPMLSAIGIVITDLSDKRKQEEALALYQRKLEIKVNELNQTNSSLEQFIHVISHDIKEPLRKIIAYSSHLNENQQNHLTDMEIRNLNVISNSAVRLNSLVDDLVKYSFSTIKIDLVEVDLNAVLKEVKEDLELVIEESGAEIICRDIPVIIASRVQMRQLFSNLINNAIKYRKKEVPVKILISAEIIDNVDLHFPDKKFYKISLQDNGIGMEQDQLGKIFTIFQRLHMQNEYSGNGIGLAICKKIMENHLGKVEVESLLDHGSTFHLYFPVKK
ncbi:PAS domain-containing sensor histidine kinase [Sphingobacteriaceae bacterium]|nr:PAS domain-containing sensor histidine kinase [Sphingobacteriaceae bacterium]